MSHTDQNNLRINRNLGFALMPTHLELILMPTEACNFRCSYCYEDFEIGRMKENTVRAIKKLISERAKDLQTLHLSWFGGEPLLAKDILFDISAHAKAECKKQGVSFIRGEITTNGYTLNLLTLQALVALNQSSFQISLDGYGAIHDSTRKMISGKGTFEKIWGNLLAMHQSDYDFSVKLRLHLTPSNLSSIKTLIEQIKSQLLPDPRFNVMFKKVGDWGGPNAGHINSLGNDVAEEAIVKFKSQLALDGQPAESGLALPSCYICYAAKPNSLLIRANGNIGKCTVALNDPRNNIGHINDDGTLALDNESLLPWIRGYKDRDFDALGCPLSGLPKRVQKEEIITFAKPARKPIESASIGETA